MQYIDEKQIENIEVSAKELIELVDEVLRNKKDSQLPAKTSIKWGENHNFFNIMPCSMPGLNLNGVKCISRYADRTPSLDGDIILYDYLTGELKTIVDAKKITVLRTAAVAIHSLKLLAKKDYKSVALVGLGEIGKATLKLLIDLNDRELDIRLLNYKDHAVKVKEMYKDVKDINISIYDSYEDMVKDCDVVMSAVTYIENDFAEESIYKPGVTIIPIHTRGFMNCDLTFDKIFGDDYNHVSGFKYFNEYKSFNEVADVILGNCKGRENDQERILVYNIGIALHDVALANKFLEKIKKD